MENRNEFNRDKATILIVDDNPSNISVLAEILRPFYLVKAATNGRLALKIASSTEPPDMILLDIMMPEMDGYQVCAQLKNNALTQKIPVIFVTAMGEMEDETHGLDLGAVDFISKPIRSSIVKARIKNHLSLYDQNRELEKLVKQRTAEIEENRTQIIHRLGVAAEYRDEDTGNHIHRIGQYSQLLAVTAGLGDEQADLLLLAAPMHDVGKIGIPDCVLLKPGKLDVDEWAMMKQHPTIGAKIIGEHPAALLKMARQVALTHHERWDGTGYPDGLNSANIPVVGRIVAIADVFDALIHERPYKQAWTVDDAVAEIKTMGGRHFDPVLVDAFLTCLPELLQINRAYSD